MAQQWKFQMKKFYYPKGNPKHYWEYWENGGGTYTVHWGELGTNGRSTVVKNRSLASAQSQVLKLENEYKSNGYEEIDFEEQYVLLIEYTVDGFGNANDLDKRHSLENYVNGVLGWTGLGHCDGGSIGSGSMEVCCIVVDYEIARQVVAERLRDTEFSDYSRIYQER